jgi:N-acyl-D-amino-acid deacylase
MTAVRTAVMGEDASVRQQPTAAELAEMKHLVAKAMDQGAIGMGASYSLNHSGWGGVPMPSTMSDIAEFDALVGAMGGPGRGIVEISSGPIMPDRMEEIAAQHSRRIFMSTAVALYHEQYPDRALGVFDACAAAQARGAELYIQITCQPPSHLKPDATHSMRCSISASPKTSIPASSDVSSTRSTKRSSRWSSTRPA